MSLTSPEKGHRLQQLDGVPADIESRGLYLVRLGGSMERTADKLKLISEGETQIADSVDKLRETAGAYEGDLRSAGTRYKMTGEVLRDYATALETAKNTMDPLVDDIQQAHDSHQAALAQRDEARSALNGLDNRWPWEDEPTEAERTAASSAAREANGDVTSAGTALSGLWTTYDTAFDKWETAYDDAVTGIQTAIDTADNNDGGWELLDSLIEIAGWVVVGLAVVALFVTGPLAVLITVIAVAVSAAILIAEIVKMQNGRGDWMSLGLAAFGLISFGLGGAISKLLSKGAPSVRALISGGRGTVYQSIRRTLPAFRLRTPFANIGNWWRARSAMRAGTQLPTFVAPWNGLRYGPGYARLNSFNNMVSNNFGHFPDVANWVNNVGRANLPGVAQQAVNTGMWTTVTGLGVYGNVR